MNKRGQFFLIAAIVIISASIGFFVVSNSVSSQQNYDASYLKDELTIESQKVINYGIVNHYDNAQMENSLYSLANLYINSTPQDDWYFIFNGTNGMNVTIYQNFPATVRIDGFSPTNTLQKVYSEYFNPSGSTVSVMINNYNYNFQLSNENFFFIISSQSGGQNYM